MVLAVKGEFQSTPSARRATLHPALEACFIAISIHALREEDDRKSSPGKAGHRNFNPRPPRGGRLAQLVLVVASVFISIHALREEGDCRCSLVVVGELISIHALREEGDMACIHGGYGPLDFNPRPPRGGRRAGPDLRLARHHISIHALREESDRSTLRIRQAARISIHALREESDLIMMRSPPRYSDFNPRPPRGGRLPLLACCRR